MRMQSSEIRASSMPGVRKLHSRMLRRLSVRNVAEANIDQSSYAVQSSGKEMRHLRMLCAYFVEQLEEIAELAVELPAQSAIIASKATKEGLPPIRPANACTEV